MCVILGTNVHVSVQKENSCALLKLKFPHNCKVANSEGQKPTTVQQDKVSIERVATALPPPSHPTPTTTRANPCNTDDPASEIPQTGLKKKN